MVAARADFVGAFATSFSKTASRYRRAGRSPTAAFSASTIPTASGGSTLSIGGALTNSGSLDVENYGVASSPSVNFRHGGVVRQQRQGQICSGNTNNSATLNVSGALTNNGSISITDDIEELAGAVGGTGSFTLYERQTSVQLECLVRSDHRQLA